MKSRSQYWGLGSNLQERVLAISEIKKSEYRKKKPNKYSFDEAVALVIKKADQKIKILNAEIDNRVAAGEPKNLVLLDIENKTNEINERADITIGAMERRRAEARAVAERAKNGFHFPGGIVGLQRYPEHQSYVVKKDLNPMLLAFSTKLSRGRSKPSIRKGVIRGMPIAGSNNKIYRETFSHKIMALDCAWIESNPLMRGLIRIDLDKTFDNIETLIHEVKAHKCPLPNIIVCQKMGMRSDGAQLAHDTMLVHPHLYYVLEESVCWTEKARKKPQRLFLDIQSVITHRLGPIGADKNGSANSLRGKNPLSPLNISMVVVPHTYHLKGDLASADSLMGLLNMSREETKVAKVKSLQGHSNQVFVAAIDVAKSLIRDFHPKSPRRLELMANGYAADDHSSHSEAMLMSGFSHTLKRLVSNQMTASPDWADQDKRNKIKKNIDTTCDHVAKRFWDSFDPNKIHVTDKRRGIMYCPDFKKQASSAAERAILRLKSAKTVHEAESAGAQFAATIKREATIGKLVAAAISAGMTDGAITSARIRALMDATGLSMFQCRYYRGVLPAEISAELRRRKKANARYRALKRRLARSITGRSDLFNATMSQIINSENAFTYKGFREDRHDCEIRGIDEKTTLRLSNKDINFIIRGVVNPTKHSFYIEDNQSDLTPHHTGALALKDITGALKWARIINHVARVFRMEQESKISKESPISNVMTPSGARQINILSSGRIASNLAPWKHKSDFNEDGANVYIFCIKSAMCDGNIISITSTRTIDESNIFTRERVFHPDRDENIGTLVSYAESVAKGGRYQFSEYDFADREYDALGMAA